MRAAVRAGISLAALVLTAAVPRNAHAATPIAPEMRTVTLISGDRLLISPDGGSASRLPSPGRDDVPLLSHYVDGRLEVVPADAVDLLNAGRLDPRLFDVTELLDDGYDDASGAMPLIITYDTANPAAAVRAAAGGVQVRDLDTINGLAVRVKTSTTATMWARLTDPSALLPAYRRVWLDGIARPSIDVSVPLVGAPAAWAAGWTGSAVGVGVLDTGIDAGHPDLAQSVAASADFTGDGDGIDRSGHGTHVASIIAGSGAASAGRFRGMAPDARLYSAKVCRAGRCPESAILAGMQWAARDENLKIVSMSLGRRDGPGLDLLEQAVDTLTARFGTLFVVAAGNSDGRVSSPASADAALAVGATTVEDQVAAFSDPGPRAGDDGLKPDIAAPGVDIEAARSSASSLPRSGPGGRYTRLSGTSMAAPHVAGAAAILAQEHPDWTPGQLKADLMNAATPIAGAGPDQVGAGRLDVAKAAVATVLAEPGSLSFGRLSRTKTITYRNAGTAPATLALTPSPGVTLDARTVTVPGRGKVTVVVTAAAPTSRRITGAVAAVGADVSLRTPYEVERSTRDVRLTVHYTDRSGAAAATTYGGVTSADGRRWVRLPNRWGTGTVELPKGTYTLDAAILGAGGPAVLNQPRLVLDRDTTIELSAGDAAPVVVPAPARGAQQVFAQLGFALPSGARGSVTGRAFGGWSAGAIGDGLTGLRTTVAGTWAVDPEATVYSAAWAVAGAFVDGFRRTVSDSDLARVSSSYRAAGPVALSFGFAGDDSGIAGYATAVSGARTEYFNTDGDVRWGARAGVASGPLTAYATGSSVAATWDAPVFGPAFPPPNPWSNGVIRNGDTILVNPSWFSDGSGEHGGPSPGAAHHLVVTRDGVTLSDTRTPSVSARAPAGPGLFTITDESTRPATYSPRTRTSWTFRSSRSTGPLPLSAIRFTPGARGALAFTVQRQPGSDAGVTRLFVLQVSYDDGTTWRSPLFARLGDRGVAVLHPPAGAFVSLRASAADAAGNRVEQTLLHAYRNG
jgi:subtilisin family serine protease